MKLKIYLLDYSLLSLDYLLGSSYLTSLDKKSFNKYTVENVKKEKIVSTILKRKYIGDYYLNEYGKPLSKDKCFNISHSHGYIALVIDTVNVGIDIEKIRDVDSDLMDYISNVEERNYIHDNVSFFEIWTNKEALVKASGTGIRNKPNFIPGLPLNGIIVYNNKNYFNKTIRYDDLIITTSKEDVNDYEIEIIKEVI